MKNVVVISKDDQVINCLQNATRDSAYELRHYYYTDINKKSIQKRCLVFVDALAVVGMEVIPDNYIVLCDDTLVFNDIIKKTFNIIINIYDTREYYIKLGKHPFSDAVDPHGIYMIGRTEINFDENSARYDEEPLIMLSGTVKEALYDWLEFGNTSEIVRNFRKRNRKKYPKFMTEE